eukprot:scaffold1558_cov403-Prasinococcus_capsulatus_cf.AAC.17
METEEKEALTSPSTITRLRRSRASIHDGAPQQGSAQRAGCLGSGALRLLMARDEYCQHGVTATAPDPRAGFHHLALRDPAVDDACCACFQEQATSSRARAPTHRWARHHSRLLLRA